MILEIDRFGRCYMTLRDEFDRLIAIETKQPSSSDGPAWNISAPANGTPLRPADRIYLGNLFFGDVAGVSWEEWERLPGALAQTSFNGQPCEAYHHDRRSRQRQGAVLSYAKEDVRRTLDLHIQRWRESGNEFLYERIVGSNIDSSNRDSLHLAAVDALFRDLPQDMHHFQALLRSLPQALSGGGRRDE